MSELGKLYTVAEVAAYLRCSRKHLYSVLIPKMPTQPARLGDGKQAEYRFTQAEVDALLEVLRPAAPITPTRKRGAVA